MFLWHWFPLIHLGMAVEVDSNLNYWDCWLPGTEAICTGQESETLGVNATLGVAALGVKALRIFHAQTLSSFGNICSESREVKHFLCMHIITSFETKRLLCVLHPYVWWEIQSSNSRNLEKLPFDVFFFFSLSLFKSSKLISKVVGSTF